MIVVDIESSGTDFGKHSIVSIGAVDLLKPHRQFYDECRIWEGSSIMKGALEVNGFTEESLRDENKKTEGEIVKAFLAWADDSENYMVAGQNPSFDLLFIQSASYRNKINFFLPYRTLDLHSVCFGHMLSRGISPPVLKRKSNLESDGIMDYVGIPKEPRPHIALNGARYEAEAFSRLLYDKKLFEEFFEYDIPWLNIS